MAKAKSSAKGRAQSARAQSSRAEAARAASIDLQTPTEDLTLAQKVSWFALLATIFIVPIAISNFTFLGFQLPFTFDAFDIVKVTFLRFGAIVALGAWLWHILRDPGKNEIRHTVIDWLVLAFLAWVTLSAIFSIHPATAIFGKYRRFEGLLSFITYAILFWLVMQFSGRPSRIRQLAQTLFWSSTIVAGYGVLQAVGIDPIKWAQLPFEANRSFSTYGNPDLFGGFLMFSLPVAAALALSEERPTWRIVWWIGLLINVVTWITAFTRGAWIGGAVGFVALGIVVWRQMGWPPKEKANRNIDLALLAVIAVIGITIIVGSLSNPNEVMNFSKRFASITQFNEGSGKTRTEIWEAAIAAIKDRPIFGFGADTFRLVFPKYKPAAYVKDAGYLSVADNVHDYPLQLAAGIGIPGALLLYVIFGWVAVRSAPFVFGRPSKSKATSILVGGFWAAAAGYITMLMFGLSVTGTTFLLWVSMGVVLGMTAEVKTVEAPSWGSIAVAVTSGILAVLFVYNAVYIYADNRYLYGRLLPAGPERIAYAEQAVRLNPFNDMYRSDLGVAYVETTLQTLRGAIQAEQQGTPPAQAMSQVVPLFNQSVTKLREAIAFTPWEYDNYVFLTNLYVIGGQYINPAYYQQALETAKAGIGVEQYGPAIRLQYAEALIATNNKAEATKQLEYAASLDPAYADAANLLSQLYEQSGQKDKALAVLKNLAKFNPTEATNVAASIKRLEASATTQ